MSGTTGTAIPGSTAPLFEHALRLHRRTPDAPLPRDGEPYPDEARRRRRKVPDPPRDRNLVGVDVARLLDAHFADPHAAPRDLTGRFRDVHVPIHPSGHIAAAAGRAGERGRETGRWLVRHGTETYDVVVGLALLAAVGTARDIPRIQTVGLLSCTFGPLSANALERLPQGADALLWLAERVTGWGRVYVVEALCRLVEDHPAVRSWLTRRAVDGDVLNGYFAGRVAQLVGLHEVMAQDDVHGDVVDHTGRILQEMSCCEGMGLSLKRYPYASVVMKAHARTLARLGPSPERFLAVALLVHSLGDAGDRQSVGPVHLWETARSDYLALLDRADWCEAARQGLMKGDEQSAWAADLAGELDLLAFRMD
ncbi:hypothetical protein [Streptomyces sp. NPDC012510]|uniref:hypothetical protein n=1 Tax=Streptomyces sp. NPDC012510 TaxID=3364838 RepID=UPI0036E53032